MRREDADCRIAGGRWGEQAEIGADIVRREDTDCRIAGGRWDEDRY